VILHDNLGFICPFFARRGFIYLSVPKSLTFDMSIESTLLTKCPSFRKDNTMRMIMMRKLNHPMNLLESFIF